jgi:Protein of unknown function (DUF3102)
MNEDVMKTNQRTLGEITVLLYELDRRGTIDAQEIGALLIEARERLAADGQSFTDWLHAKFAWSHRTADRFMRARKWYESQTADTRHCVESSLTVTALYVLSAAEVPAEAQSKILKLAREQRVGGTAARKIVAEVRAEAEPPSGEPEAAEGSPALGLVMAVETLLRCDPEAENLEGLSAPALVRAAEILTALARRLRGDDSVKLAADRAEARSAMAAIKMASIVPCVEGGVETRPIQPCPIDHSATGAVPLSLCRMCFADGAP